MTDERSSLPASVRRLTRHPAPGTFRLFCFPYAGAGAYMFRSWAAALPPQIELYAIQLPGREDRIRELPMTRLDDVTAMLTTDLGQLTDRPYGFFGHSLGAVLSAEVARRLTLRQPQAAPSNLFVSGCRSLQIIERHRQAVHDLDDEDLIAHIRKLNGTPEEILRDPGMMTLILRLIRADYALFDQYTYTPGPPLRCPVTVLGGDADPSTSEASLTPWSELTSGPTDVHIVPGDHFFVVSAQDQVVEVLTRRLRESEGSGVA